MKRQKIYCFLSVGYRLVKVHEEWVSSREIVSKMSESPMRFERAVNIPAPRAVGVW